MEHIHNDDSCSYHAKPELEETRIQAKLLRGEVVTTLSQNREWEIIADLEVSPAL